MYELQVDGMTCGGCAASVKRAVQNADSKAEVDVDLGSKTVRVKSGANLETVTSAVEDAGYPVVSSATV